MLFWIKLLSIMISWSAIHLWLSMLTQEFKLFGICIHSALYLVDMVLLLMLVSLHAFGGYFGLSSCALSFLGTSSLFQFPSLSCWFLHLHLFAVALVALLVVLFLELFMKFFTILFMVNFLQLQQQRHEIEN